MGCLFTANTNGLMRSVVCAYQAASRCLVVFSGPRSLSHPWINKEIIWWCERFGIDRVYFALTHGDLQKDAQDRPILSKVMLQELADVAEVQMRYGLICVASMPSAPGPRFRARDLSGNFDVKQANGLAFAITPRNDSG
jgi:hypothetical protein